MPIVTGTNSLDILKGALPRLQVGGWKTAGGAPDSPALTDMGFLRDVTFDLGRDYKFFSADNVTWDIDGYHTGSHATLKGTILEASLRKLATVMNDDPAASTGDVKVTAATSAVYALDEPYSARYWQLVLTIAGQSMTPAYTEDATRTYIQRVITLWRTIFITKISQTFKKDDEVRVPFEAHCLLDTSITYSKGVIGRIGKIVDTP